MIKKNIIWTIFILIMLTYSSSIVLGTRNVEVFTQYNTKINIYENNTFIVQKEIYLRNIHDVGIVPGEIQFKVFNTMQDDNGKILWYNATDRYGNNIKSDLLNTDNGYVILLDIFTPILPGFEYIINLNYSVEFNPSGFFFNNVQIPLKENTEIPIKEGSIKVNLPEKYHITYASYKDNSTIVNDKNITWAITNNTPSNVNIEYSSLPIRIENVKGSALFWLTINLILIIILIIHSRRILAKHGKLRNKKSRKKHQK